MEYFVDKASIVRQIWGKSDTILFVFAGAAAEFALNKAVDWLYFTGRLPNDPMGRLFSTVSYARRIIFLDKAAAYKAIDAMSAIHAGVEKSRGASIPDWAYRDVLFMLIHYSIAAFEVLERKLTTNEKEEVFNVFYRVGQRMGLKGLPTTFNEWLVMRTTHLNNNLERSQYTLHLFQQYKKQLGLFRYLLLRQVQIQVAPQRVNQLLGFSTFSWLQPVLFVYKLTKKLKVDEFFKKMIYPPTFKKQIMALDQVTAS